MPALPTPAPAPVPHRRAAMFEVLAGERPDAQGYDPEADAFVYVDRTWVTLWYDPDHSVRSQCGGMIAYRAITTTGDLLWYVAPAGEAPVYHAQCADPYEAIEHATVALGAQGDLNRRWMHIERVAQDLRAGRARFDVTWADARTAQVAPAGFRALMAVTGVCGAPRLSGRVAAMLMKLDPSMGHIIYAAWLRAQGVEAPTITATQPKAPRAPYAAIC